MDIKYFILKPRSKSIDDIYAKASRQAMYIYSYIITEKNRKLSKEIWNSANKEEKKCDKLRRGIWKK